MRRVDTGSGAGGGSPTPTLPALLAALVALALVVVGALAACEPDGGEAGGTAPRQVSVLAYHGVTADAAVVADDSDPRYVDVRPAAFDEHMRYLHDAGYETITPGWYLTWDQLEDMRAGGTWIMQFHAGPRGHAYVDDPRHPACHRFYPREHGEDADTYRARVKSDVALGLGAMRTAFGLPAGWQGPTFAVPWDDAVTSDTAPDPWLPAYFADQFPVVFVQESWIGPANHQRYRHEIHNPEVVADFRAALTSSHLAR